MVMCVANPCYTRFLSVALSCVCVSHRHFEAGVKQNSIFASVLVSFCIDTLHTL